MSPGLDIDVRYVHVMVQYGNPGWRLPGSRLSVRNPLLYSLVLPSN